jgi:hypothetical protein
VQETPFDNLAHLVLVTVLLNGAERRFILDSGIGLNLVRDSVAGCRATGASFTGKRMSGQEVSVPLAVATRLAFAGVEQRDTEVGLLDMQSFPQEFGDVDGFLSLAFFAAQPFTVDYAERTIRDGTDAAGTPIPVHVEVDGPAVTVFMPLVLPGGRTVSVEVDMGSDSLILDERFAAEAGVQLDADHVRRVEGLDETGNAYIRTFTRLEGTIHPAGQPELAQHDPEVMFQRLIYDGLIGHAFLRDFAVSWDLPRSRIQLAQA